MKTKSILLLAVVVGLLCGCEEKPYVPKPKEDRVNAAWRDCD